ncbi:hypothetical protein PIB30_089677 [Stylosanthes scabra]|uniref:Uncharacterized protein n=1 Tax=Stylosanthes scabra TaxID=79078 RepID=A0ABU6TVH5_9FABA|nr:hypothetical protein [Stylosanthes scabra]
MEATHVEDNSKKVRNTRGKTKMLKIHSRTWEEREEVIFDGGAAVGPTRQRVKDLTNFIGTIGRDSDFITLMYTNWKAVPKQMKKQIWKFINSKFILPKSSKPWVMTGVQGAWKQVQFRKLIAYWSIPAVKAMCVVNSENRKKQQCRHKMEPINFASVRVDLHEKEENKEEPNQAEMFVATQNGLKGKAPDVET